MDSIASSVTVAAPPEGFRVSPQQRFRWLGGRRDDTAQAVIRLSGPLDPQTLEAAVGRVVARHESLRTRILGRPGVKVPLQVILDSAGLFWSRAELDVEKGASEIAALLEEDARFLRVESLEGPSCRFRLVARSATEHLLLVTLPGLLADAVTLGLLVGEIAAAYRDPEAYEAESEEAVQYLQFSEWRNDVLAEGESGAAEAFWSAAAALCRPFRLAVVSEPEPGEEPRPQCVVREVLEPETAGRLLRTGAARDWLLAAWAGLLGRLTGAAGVGLACIFDGRKFEDLAGVLGFLAGPVPLHVSFEEGFRFAEVVERAAAAVRDAARWQEYLPEETPFLDDPWAIGFSCDEWPEPEMARGVRFALAERRLPDSPWQLELRCALRDGGGVETELRYDGAAYRIEDAQTLLGQLAALLREGLAAPDTPLADLDVRGAEEIGRRLPDPTPDRPLASMIHELFERAAREKAGSPAVACGEESVTYFELNLRANRLAQRLSRLGVGPEERVALCFERSVELVVAMLATLKAGGAYVPLDPGLPVQRLAALLRESGARVLAVRGAAPPELSECGAAVLDLDAEAGSLATEPAEVPRASCHPESLAYVLFTSGSTGGPKGVAVEHRQLLAYLQGIRERLDLPAEASYAMVSSFAADLGNTAIFPALCFGGCLHVVPQECITDPVGLAEAFARHPADCLKIVPSHLAALLDSAVPAGVLPRRLLVLGGEAAGRELVSRVRRFVPGLRILNHYGPTETTVGVTTCPAERWASDPRLQALPLGEPIAGARVRLVDRRLAPIPDGAAGELVVAGAGVARGYLGRPELTAERFLPDPFSPVPGGRLYRTGDLVRRLPNGALRFEGRLDHQVKIRGIRVELGEIEATLRLDSAVRAAVAAVFEDEPGRPRLAAYVVPRRGAEVDLRRLRDLLRRNLPEAMVPASLIALDALPLNANGKVDRRALPAPEEAAAEPGRRFVAPRNLGEEMIAGLWREILGVESVGIHDSFFDLGGHSLLATRLISRLRKAFGVELPLAAFFDGPTVAELSAAVERERGGGARAEIPLERVPRGASLPLSYAQERLWFMGQLEPASSAYNVPRAVRLLGSLELGILARALTEIGRRHEVLRTTFVAVEGEARQVIHDRVDLSPAVIDLRELPEPLREAEAVRLAVLEGRRPFDLGQGPLMRVALFRFAPEEHVALLTLHHIVSDAWSMGVLVGELAEIYGAFATERPPVLEDLPIQYADYASWQRRRLEGEALEDELGFWRRTLAGAPEELLPTDFERPVVASSRGENLSRTFGRETASALGELCRQEGATLFMALLAGLKALLHRETGTVDVVVGTDVANRTRVELEGLIGFFVNNLVLRTDLSGNPTFRELLGRVRASTLAAFCHQDLPFDRLVKALKPRRVPGRTPLFQVLFVLQNAPRRELRLADVTLQPFDLGATSSKFDIALFVTEEERGLVATWSYRQELFSRATVARLGDRLETLLEGACREPDTPLGSLAIDSEVRLRERNADLQAREDARVARLRGLRRSKSTGA